MDLPPLAPCSVLLLGIDDFSFGRGQWFGTILVNLERHPVTDLLPDRQAETSAQWMRQRPEITVVSRDRGREYASAASVGAQEAIQLAERFHLCKKLTEATQLLLARGPGGNRGSKQKGRAMPSRASKAPDQYPRVASC